MSIVSLFVRRMHAIGEKRKEKEESSCFLNEITSAVVM
jgi:hypothetical protein